jgi:hypothetical protein
MIEDTLRELREKQIELWNGGLDAFVDFSRCSGSNCNASDEEKQKKQKIVDKITEKVTRIDVTMRTLIEMYGEGLKPKETWLKKLIKCCKE